MVMKFEVGDEVIPVVRNSVHMQSILDRDGLKPPYIVTSDDYYYLIQINHHQGNRYNTYYLEKVDKGPW